MVAARLTSVTPEQLAMIADCPKLAARFSESVLHSTRETEPRSLGLNATKDAIGEALECLEDRLSRKGFDEDYRLDSTGKAIEGLADQLRGILLSE